MGVVVLSLWLMDDEQRGVDKRGEGDEEGMFML